MVDSKTLDWYICIPNDEANMRPSARFHEASKSYKEVLSKSKLANISTVAVGKKVIIIEFWT